MVFPFVNLSFWSGCRAIPRRAAAFFPEVVGRISQTVLAFLLHPHHHDHRRPYRLGASSPPPGARRLLSWGCAWPSRAFLVVLGLGRCRARHAVSLPGLCPTPNRRHVDGGDPLRQQWGVGHVSCRWPSWIHSPCRDGCFALHRWPFRGKVGDHGFPKKNAPQLLEQFGAWPVQSNQQ